MVRRASVRWNRGGRSEGGGISIRGELLSRADELAFDPEEGLVVRIEDGASFTQVLVWASEECRGSGSPRSGCRHRERPSSRIVYRPLARQVDGSVLYHFVLRADGLGIEDPPQAPLQVTMTSQPARRVSGFDRAGLVTECRHGRSRLTCRASAGAITPAGTTPAVIPISSPTAS